MKTEIELIYKKFDKEANDLIKLCEDDKISYIELIKRYLELEIETNRKVRSLIKQKENN